MTKIEQPTADALTLSYFLAEADRFSVADVGEVEPYDASVGFRIPPTQTWADAQETCRSLGGLKLAPPLSWSACLAVEWPLAAGWMAAGLHPQRIREQPNTTLLSPSDERALQAELRAALKSPSIAAKLIASGAGLLVGDIQQSSDILSGLDAALPTVANQHGVLAAVAGDLSTATAHWQGLGDYAPALYNRGLEAWNRSDYVVSADLFTKAAALIPEHSGWHHLARLYLILGQS